MLDDLSTGFADAVPPGATFVKGTLRDCAAEVLSDGIDAVLHFAATVAGRRVGSGPGQVLVEQPGRHDRAA